ncbi:MAG: helix-turn-helix transcriptional regulator [Sphingobacteriales bacterium]|nr:helix-turn-helix transcriptional regulator [Sphingobacteriales bacterium]
MSLAKLCGENIRSWRRLKNLKQESLSEKVNIDKTTLSKIENGSACTNLLQIEKLAGALGVPAQQLLFSNPATIISHPENKNPEGINHI